jgi:peroxiredoxin
MREVEAVYQEYKDKGVIVIGVNLLESKGKVDEFVQRGGYEWIFVIDDKGEVAWNYKVVYLPASFFLDEEGIIRAVHTGAMSKGAIDARLAEAMR